jgi:hypothetical protein
MADVMPSVARAGTAKPTLGMAARVMTLIDSTDETFRATMRGHTPEGDMTTIIVLRRGLGRDGRVWLTFNGAIRTTVVMSDPEADELTGLLSGARGAR